MRLGPRAAPLYELIDTMGGNGRDGDLFLNNAAGDIILGNADCAEDFDVVEQEAMEAGTVLVFNDVGALRRSSAAYDTRVAGVVSGAGSYRPGLVLDRRPGSTNRAPVALMGKVFCKVDATYGAVQAGDLLTTSPTPGHAMRVANQLQAFGAVIGKAMGSLREGQGLVPVLIALQ